MGLIADYTLGLLIVLIYFVVLAFLERQDADSS
jgi:hypothetical protein